MSNAFHAPMGAALASQRWLGVARLAAWICILLIGLALGMVMVPFLREEGAGVAAPFLVLAVLTLLPYLTVPFWLRGKQEWRGLQRAVVSGWGGLVGAGVGGLRCLMASVPEKWAALVLMLAQILLLVPAYRAYAAVRRQTGDQRKLTRDGWGIAVLPFLGFFLMMVGPPAMHALHEGDRLYLNQTAPIASIGSLRAINNAEYTYSTEFQHGFSPTLAALAPPADGIQPSALAADLIDSRLASGVKSGYKFTYTPGPPDKDGRIQTYTVMARPLEPGQGGQNSYFTDQTGVIRQTPEDRFANAQDPAIR